MNCLHFQEIFTYRQFKKGRDIYMNKNLKKIVITLVIAAAFLSIHTTLSFAEDINGGINPIFYSVIDPPSED